MTRYNTKTTHNRGAVSLFIVIFTSILLLVITLGFIRLMIGDQRQATLNDVSQSAYDSALAGVEDAKRMLLIHQACQNGEKSGAQCIAISQAIKNPSCSMLSVMGTAGATANQETLIKRSTSSGTGDAASSELDQAYTCVKILVNLKNYLGGLKSYQSTTIPIKPTEPFDKIRISWFNIEDIEPGDRKNVCMSYPTSLGLPIDAKWRQNTCPTVSGTNNINTPALLRVMVAQTADSGGNLDAFNDASGANTVLLYPRNFGTKTYYMGSAERRSQSIGFHSPQDVECKPSLDVGGYACSMDIVPLDTSLAKTTYIQLMAYYVNSHYRVELIKNTGGAGDAEQSTVIATPQIEVDSTGRANNLFRRVLARVELTGQLKYPSNALTVGDSLCKDYIISKTLYRDDAEGVCQ